ncbi:MAG: hypothetical protein J0H43_03800, partial [Actinobacteria bacterium]|nr:hypothetical protein [Actinomycetota bacterium]
MSRFVHRRLPSIATVASLVDGTLAVVLFASTSPASATTQNGYVFNNAWTMPQAGNLAGQYTAPSERQYATDTAVSSFDLTTGRVNVTAKIVPGAQQLPGINYIRLPQNQSYWQATNQTFVGAPTPANEPGFDLETVASNCGGAVGTAGHQDFSGTCPDSVTITFTFDKPVTDPVLDASGLGGYIYAYQFDNNTHRRYARGSFMSQRWNLLTSGVTLVGPQGAGPANLDVTPTSFGPKNLNTSPNCYQHFKDQQGTAYETPDMDSAGCGSITLRGTFTSVSFRVDQFQRTFSQYPAATSHTGP